MPGDTAVQSFFVISGFYMSLVLNGKYAGAGYWLFVSNRFLRLYPVYASVLIATLVLTPQVWPILDPLGWVYFAISQIFILGQDAVMFLYIDNKASLAFTPYFSTTTKNLFEFAPIPQAWTLGIELWFYLLAPFVLRRSPRSLIALLFASLVLRITLQLAFGLSGDPWSYRFFPSELALFLLGAVAHRADRKTLIVIAVIVAGVLLFNRPNGLGRVASVSFLAATAIAIPWLFALTQKMEVDRFLGELSYPIYLVHILVGHLIAEPGAALVATVLCAVALYLVIDMPVDRWRQNRLENFALRNRR